MSQVTQEELKQLDIVKGNVVGIALIDDFKFIQNRKGIEGVKKIEEEMARLGYLLKFKDLKSFEWYPEKLNLLLFVTQKTFDWDDNTMREMGTFGARVSIMIRFMLKYFISIKKLIKGTQYWRRYHDTGELVVIEADIQQKFAIFEISDFTPGYSSHCRYIEGYMEQIASYVIPNGNPKVRESECTFSGGKSHIFKITW